VQQNARRTWAGVPSSYVKEQRAIFADVDAFDLDEKDVVCSPFAKKQQQQQQHQMRDSLDFAKSQMLNYDFEFGEAMRHSTLSESELLSAALRSPHSKPEPKKIHIPVPSPLTTAERISLNNPFWLSSINDDDDVPSPETVRDKPVTRRSSRLSAEMASHRDSSSRLSASSWISNDEENELARPSPDVYAWDQPMRRRSSRSSVDSGRNSKSISSMDEEIPTPVGIHLREDSTILDLETASLLNRMEALHIRDGENRSSFHKMSVCTPVSEEGEEEAEEEIRGVFRKFSHCTPVPEGSEEECEAEYDTSSKDGHDDSLEEGVLMSVFDVLLQECRQAEILTLSEALSDFW
jgi:hypothetical protein